jgi:hypothetical protein
MMADGRILRAPSGSQVSLCSYPLSSRNSCACGGMSNAKYSIHEFAGSWECLQRRQSRLFFLDPVVCGKHVNESHSLTSPVFPNTATFNYKGSRLGPKWQFFVIGGSRFLFTLVPYMPYCICLPLQRTRSHSTTLAFGALALTATASSCAERTWGQPCYRDPMSCWFAVTSLTRYTWHVVRVLFFSHLISSLVPTETSINDLQIIEGIDTISKVGLPHASSFPQQKGAGFIPLPDCATQVSAQGKFIRNGSKETTVSIAHRIARAKSCLILVVEMLAVSWRSTFLGAMSGQRVTSRTSVAVPGGVAGTRE